MEISFLLQVMIPYISISGLLITLQMQMNWQPSCIFDSTQQTTQLMDDADKQIKQISLQIANYVHYSVRSITPISPV